MKVERFITYSEAEDKVDIGVMGGWFSNGHRWEDYLGMFNDTGKQYAEAIREAVLSERLFCGGDSHQSDEIASVPLFSDGKVATYSYRGWGDIMAAIWATELDIDLNYMDFYMDATIRVRIASLISKNDNQI